MDDDVLLGHMMLTAQHIAEEIGVAKKGYRVVMNCNAWGGQEVMHVHLHLLSGRQLTWPPG